MDALTHVFLPLTVVYAVWPEGFGPNRHFLLGLFGLVPDLDKLLGVPGLLHSLLTIVPITVAMVVLGQRWERVDRRFATLAAGLVLSHLLLDFLDGSGVYALYPIVETGVGLAYPIEVIFGEGPLGVTFEGWPVAIVQKDAPVGFAESAGVDSNRFGLVGSTGVASTLAFLALVWGRSWRDRSGVV